MPGAALELAGLEPALLERWMRQYYFAVDADIGSSGVECFSLRQLRELVGLGFEDLDQLVFRDSQTLGGEGVRRAIAERYAAGAIEGVMVTHGSTEANFLVMNALLRAGDEVVVLEPIYQQLYAIALGLGCRLKSWHLRPENAFRPDFTELEDLLGPRTRMVVVNFPHNPTGSTLTPAEQRELLARVARVGAFLVWDGAFTELTYDDPPLPDPHHLYERAVSMGTLSKAFGLPGLRLGWCLASPELLERFAHSRDYTLLHLSPLVELLAERAIDCADRLIGPRLATARRHRVRVGEWLAAHPEDLEWTLPSGGVCGFIRFRQALDVDAFCHRLADEERVLLVPGSCFHQPHYARLGFGCSARELETGLAATSRLLRRSVALAAAEEP